ncbi:MAG TPA: HDIG domain-containing protein [Armatimonadota bacterium]|nr:HDIG domain-containing protein [Armatimonadota bacterium]
MSIFKFPVRVGHSKKESQKKRPAIPRWRSSRVALGMGTVLVLSFLLSIHLLPDKVSLQVGDVSPAEIRAHRTVRYVDTVETTRLQEEAAKSVDRVYRIVPKAASEASESVANVFDILSHARMDESLPSTAAKVDFIKRNLRLDLSEGTLEVLLTADPAKFGEIQDSGARLVKEIMDREIRDDTDDVQEARAEFRRRVTNHLGRGKYASAAGEIGSSFIRANRILNQEGTRQAQERERRLVPEQYRQILLGDIVIGNGERVTPQHIDKFMALGLRHPQVDYVTVLCISLLVGCIVTFVIVYLARYHSPIFASTKLLVLLSLVVVLSVLGLKLGSTMLGLTLSGVQFGYFAMIWISTAGMLTTILLSPQVAVLVVALLSASSGLAMNHELRWTMAALLSSLVAIYAVSDIRHRSDLVRAAAAVCAANLAMVWLIGRISGDSAGDLLIGSGWAVAGGLGSIMLFWMGAAALEKPFGITTHLRLLELSDTNNPMLKRLLMEAPGTYSHSVFVGNIAAGAAEVIGADALLVRVASYYHDVGKMKRPQFFVENQHVENVHDRLNPSLSALVIRSHIKDGLDLAREYKLPPLICELMSQHHGTSLVRYFYNQAAGEGTDASSALEQQFRYEGRKPQSVEAALLMLADAVEAASRSLSKPTPGQIESTVEGIISEKLLDGQLDESELTFKDISRIRDSFVRSLTSMLHARIEYPEPPAAEGKKVGGDGSAGKELAAGAGGPEKTGRSRQKLSAG